MSRLPRIQSSIVPRAALGLAVLVLPSAIAAAGDLEVARFDRIGALPGDVGSMVTAVSGDGARVVGLSVDQRGEASGFWWSRPTGVVALRGTTATNRSEPFGLSYDGSMVTGGVGQGFEAIDAVWWIVPGPSLAHLMGEVDADVPGSSIGFDVSADGAVVVGIADACSCDLASQAFRWTPMTGMEGLGWLDADAFPFYSRAHGVSADGTIVVGEAEIDIDQNADGIPDVTRRLAVRYTDGDGMESLGDLPGGVNDSRAFDISADGTVVVGSSTNVDGTVAVRWVDGAIEVLDDVPGGIVGGEARAVSADGAVIVGFAEGADGGEAVAWIDGAVHSLETLVEQAGYDLERYGFALTSAMGVSDDGTVIVGRGVQLGQDRGWIIWLRR